MDGSTPSAEVIPPISDDATNYGLIAGRRLLDESKKSENFIATAHIVMGGAMLGLTLFMWPELTNILRIGNIVAAALISGYGVVTRLYLRHGHAGGFKYITTTIDTILLTAVLWMGGGVRTVKTPGFLIFLLIVAAAAFRYSTRHTLYAGLLAFFCFTGLFVFSIGSGRVTLGSLPEEFSSDVISISGQIQESVYFAIYVVLIVALTSAHRRILNKSIQHELQAQQERNASTYLRNTLCRFVSKGVAEKILEDGIETKGEAKKAAILFSDLRGFTAMCENLTPPEIMSFLNGYMRRMIDIIFENGGTLDKIIGDGLMAVFGAPYTKNDDAIRAIRCAMGMREELKKINRDRTRAGNDPIRFGVGIHYGDVVAGYLGSDQQIDYTVVGSSVNLASRIERLTAELGCDILISEDIAKSAPGTIALREAPIVTVRGIERPVRTFEILETS